MSRNIAENSDTGKKIADNSDISRNIVEVYDIGRNIAENSDIGSNIAYRRRRQYFYIDGKSIVVVSCILWKLAQ